MSSSGSATKKADVDRRWTGQDALAIGLRVSLAILPSATALVAVIATLRLTPDAETILGAVGWIAFAGAIGFAVASITSRFTVRALPLAALLRLSLAFPDQAPSRLKLAIRASSPKRLKAEVESARHHGLSSDATEAAGQVLLLTSALGEHDKRTRGHSERVRLFARLLGEEMGLDGIDLDRLQWGALLHDIGKLTIPAEILNKPGKLDDTEWAIMAGHAEASRELVAPLQPFLGTFVSAADGHHEKWDGSGYPLGVRGSAIPLPARIVAVADAYEVMTATRAYKKPMSAEAARAELTACAGTHFDPDVVRAWLNVSVGEVSKAAGPAAAIAGLPLIGELLAVAGRTAGSISALPAAVATAAPAAATAGAMTMAVVAAPGMAPTGPELALDLRPEITTPRTTTDLFDSVPSSTTITVTQTSSSPTAPTSTNAVSTTVAATAATTVAPTTTAPATTFAPTTTSGPTTTSTTTTAATTTTTPALSTSDIFTGSGGAALTVAGNVAAGADLSPAGPFGDGTFLFQDPAQTLLSDLDVNGTILPAGTVVCVHLFLTSESEAVTNAGDAWRLDYGQDILAVADLSPILAATDFLQAGGVDYGDMADRGAGDLDDVAIIGNSKKLRLKLEGPTVDSVRIFIDCAP